MADRQFGSVPVDVIIGAVHTVRRDAVVFLLRTNDSRNAKCYKLCASIDGWENQLFYLNCFYIERSEKFIAHREEDIETVDEATKEDE